MMRKTLFFAVLLLVFAGFNSLNAQKSWVSFTPGFPEKPEVELLQSNNSSIIFEVHTPGMYSESIPRNGENFKRLSIVSCSNIIDEGYPELPYIRQLVAVPDCDDIVLNIAVNDSLSFNDFKVYPAPLIQVERMANGFTVQNEIFTQNDSIYNLGNCFPGELAQISTIGYIRGQRVAEIIIFPIQFKPAKDELIVYPEVEITLEFSGVRNNICVNNGIFNNLTQNVLLNYTEGGIGASINNRSQAPGTVQYVQVTNNMGQINADYIIIAAPAFYTPNDLNPATNRLLAFAQHKARHNGLDVVIVNVANLLNVGYYYPHEDPNMKQRLCIRRFLESVFENGTAQHTFDGKIGYALLVGDITDWPQYRIGGWKTRTQFWDPVNPGEIIEATNDYAYSCVTKYFDGYNYVYDNFGDFFIGRFCVDSDEKLDNIVTKTINFETVYQFEPWRKDITLIAGYANGYDSFEECVDFAENIIPESYKINKYKYRLMMDSISDKITESFDEGRLLIDYRGHGSPESWFLDNEVLYVVEPEAFNGDKQGIVHGITCSNGQYDWGVDCVAETMTTYEKNKGCVLFLGATEITSHDQNNLFYHSLHEAIWGNFSHISGEYTLEAQINTLSSVNRDVPNDSIDLTLGEASPYFYVIFGDPALNIMSQGYQVVENVTLSDTINISTDITITNNSVVTISDSSVVYLENNGSIEVTPGAQIIIGNNVSFVGQNPGGTINIAGEVVINGVCSTNIKFVVNNGGALKLYGTLKHSEDIGLDVMPGGYLCVDGGRLTSTQNFWHGVYVYGNASLTQTTTNQGFVVLKNNSIIENAIKGISTSKNDALNMTGGIVQASNTVFKNNGRDLCFLPYDNILTTTYATHHLNNISFFSTCQFQTDSNSVFTSNNEHVQLMGVDGIVFKGCHFIDSRNIGIQNGRCGIYSTNSSFHVNEFCSVVPPFPAPVSCDGLRTDFVNLKYAIRAYGLNTPSKSITVKNTDFTNNYRGIYLSGIDNTEILLNNFTIPLGNSSDNHSYGVYLDGGTNYQVEGNDFQGNIIGSKGISYGVVTKNTGSDYNQIYRNTFANLTIGIEAIGNNKGDFPTDGLEIKCNDFANGRYDVFVTPDITDGNTLPVGIRELQGSTSSSNTTAPAGNLFGNSSPILVSNYKNQGENITYISHDPASNSRVVPLIYDANTIGIIPTQINMTDQSCPDKTVTPGSLTEISEEQTEAATEAAAIEAELADLVDNGNTELLEQEVLNTNTNNAYSSYNALLEVSPYISEEVLQTIGTKEEGLSNAMIRDIMVANPQAAKSEEVLGALDNRENQLSWYMRSQIEAGRTILGAKELLEIAYAIKATAYRDATGRGIRSIVHYEEDADLNELRAWLENLPEFEYRLLYAETWFAENDFQNGLQSLLDIADNMELTEMQQGIVNDYVLFYQNLESWAQNNPALTGLDENAIALLQTLAVKDNSIGAKARNLLVINNVSDYEEPLYLPLEERNSAANAPVIALMPKVENNVSFRVYPNPAREYFTIEWCGLGEENTLNAKVLVSGMDGRGISEVKVNEACNQKIIDTRSWASGNYTLSLLVDGIIVKTLKLNISK